MVNIFLKVLNFRITLATIAAALVTALAMMQDLIQYHFYDQSAFNFFESLLFESFWIIFAPLSAGVVCGFKALNAKFPVYKLPLTIATTLFVSALHFSLYSFIVFAVSYVAGGHVFHFKDVLKHSLAENLYLCLLVYLTVCIVFLKFKSSAPALEIPSQDNRAGLARINITNGTNNILIETSDITFITASSPYSCIHTGRGKFLYPETLKSLEEKLDSAQFVRVHKSSIVNVKRVTSYKSRLNGDYDLTLENGELVRMSRNYKMKFRSLFS